MTKQLEMLDSTYMIDLILQSIGKSDLFRSDWDREFVKIVLEMALIKGDFPHFVKYYGSKVDRNDFEVYFRKSLICSHGKEVYEVILKNYYGDVHE